MISKIIKKVFTFIFLLIVSTTIFSCKENPVNDKDISGRRDYEWTQDTLKVSADKGYLSIIKMWGSSPTDIWAVGWAYRNENCVWHYDGTNWNNVAVDRYIAPFTVYGFASNDVWIGGTDGAFWHYDGTKLSKHTQIQLDGYRKVSFEELRGSSPIDIYAVGEADSIDGVSISGMIYHFNGTVWEKVNLWIPNNNLYSLRYNNYTGNYIIISYETLNQTAKSKVYRFDGKSLKTLYTINAGLGLDNIGHDVYVAIESIIYKYEEDTLKIFKDFSHPGYKAPVVYGGRIWGRSETDFFTLNQGWWVGHYNGIDLINIYQATNLMFSDAILFPYDVFLIGTDISTNYNVIIHGKLKKEERIF